MIFSRLSLFVGLMAALPTYARPYDKRSEDETLSSPHAVLDRRLSAVKRFDEGTCNLQSAVQYMNLAAASSPEVLPAPNSDLQLYHVAIGRGTQNYTCDLSNSTAVPVSIGAYATFFNVSCLAADAPELLNFLPSIALDLPVPTSNNFEAPLMSDISGYQYFIDNYTVPYFNLDTPEHHWGQSAMNKTGVADAPPGATAGEYGAVSWLQLDDVPGEIRRFRQIYRLNTAGGNPPTTCQGQQPNIEVQYAAEYWFFV